MPKDLKENCLLAFSGLLVIFMCYFGYLLFFDGTIFNPPITYWDGSFAIQNTPLHPGDAVIVSLYATKYRPVVPSIQWQIRNKQTGLVYQFQKNGSSSVGWNEYIIPVAQLPTDARPGDYSMEGLATYDIGLRTVSIVMRAPDFTVIPREEK